MKSEIGKILRELCSWKQVMIIEAEVCPDHIHIPTNFQTATTLGGTPNTIQINLKKKALRIDSNAVLAQRLKKIASIKSKLERESNMKLSRMQDIGGCRAIMRDIECVYR